MSTRAHVSRLVLALSLGFSSFALQTNPAFAQCVTTGAITDDCNLNSATTGAITIGDTVDGVTVTLVNSSAIINHTIDDDNSAPDGVLLLNSQSTVITQNAAIGGSEALAALTLTRGDWTANADITVGDITLGGGNTVEVNLTANIDANITGSNLVETFELNTTGSFGQAGNLIDLSAGDDVINVNAATQFNADTLDAGLGDDTMTIDGADIVINSELIDLDVINLNSTNTLTFANAVTNSEVNLQADGTAVVFNASGADIDVDIVAADGSAFIQTVTLTDGNLNGTMNLFDGDDIINLNGGTYSGSINMGADNDALNIGIATIDGNVVGGNGADTITINAATFTSGGTYSSVETFDLNSNTVNLSHTITGLDTADNTGLDLNSGTLNINDGGSVTGTIHSTGGSGTGLIDYGANGAGGSFTFDGLVEDAALTVTSGTLNTGSVTGGANSALGDLTIASSGTLYLTGTINSGANLTNDGTVRIASSATLNADDHVAATGSYQFDIDENGDNGTILINSGDFDATGSTIIINPDNSANLVDGQEVLLAQGTTQVNNGTGQTAITAEDTSFYYDFIIADGSQSTITTGGSDNTQLYAEVVVSNDINDIADNTNNASAANAARDIRQTSVAGLDQIVSAINNVQSASELNAVAEAIQPTADAGHYIGAITSTLKAFDITRTRLASMRSGTTTGISTGSIYDNQSHIWGKAFGDFATQDERQGIDGYESRTHGLSVGIDNDITSKATLGVSLTYAKTRVESNNNNETETDIHNYQVMTYADYDITDRTYLNGMVGVSFGKNNSTRRNIGGTELDAKGEFSSYQFNAQTEIGHDFSLNNGLQITPSVKANYVYYNADNYQEDGAGGASLIISNDSMQSLELGVGLDTSFMLRAVGTPEVFRPTLHLGYRDDIIGDKLETVSRFSGGGASFKTEGFEPATETFEIGGSLEYFTPKLWSLELEYGMDIKEDYRAHQISGQAKYAL